MYCLNVVAHSSIRRHHARRTSQQGVVVFLALIALVALTLGGLALFRSADVGVLVVGNMGMQRGATRAGDAGTNAAVTWLDANGGIGSTVLYTDSAANGYSAAGVNDVPGTNQTWSQYWDVLVANHPAATLPQDPATGNQVSYVIQRLCDNEGAPYSASPALVRCVKPSSVQTSGGSKAAGAIQLRKPTAVYYRVTSRIAGPRNTVSYIQTMLVK